MFLGLYVSFDSPICSCVESKITLTTKVGYPSVVNSAPALQLNCASCGTQVYIPSTEAADKTFYRIEEKCK